MTREISVRPLAPWQPALIVASSFVTALLFAQFPTIPDVGWLLEASRRWLAGSELYRDIIEVNPPLIFYEMTVLTGGLLTPTAFAFGVGAVIALSCLWVRRLGGPWAAALAAMLVGGLADFGQRDHLALIFFIPLLFAGRADRRERIAIGLWAFLGTGLKPYFLAMPIAVAVARAVQMKSFRPLFSPEMLALAGSCVAYLIAVAAFHPAYLTEIVPLANAAYVAAAPLRSFYLILTAILSFLALTALLSNEKVPLAAALIGALASFYLQGRGWPYQFVPAIGLGILLALSLKNRAAIIIAALLCAVQLVRGPYRWEPPYSPPTSLKSMAILTADVWPAYPLGLKVRNTSRYPSLWTIPGSLSQPELLAEQREIIRSDILRERPEAIFVDTRNIDFIAILGPFPGYRYAGREWIYDVWVLSPRQSVET